MAVQTPALPTMSASAPRPDALPIANAAVLHLKGDLRGALDCLLSVDPALESADLLKSRGYLQIELKDFASAAASYESAVAKQPDSVENWFQLGFCLHKLGRIEEALAKFEQAAKRGGDWIEIPLARAVCHLGLKQYAQCIEHADRCLEKNPVHVPALFTKGVAFQLTWELDQASTVYRQILEREPANAQVLANLITSGLQQKKYDAVQSDSEALLAADPNHLQALEGIAISAFARDDYAAAARGYERLTQLAPNQAEHWLNLGITLRKLGRTVDSIEPYRRARQIRPDSVHACTHLGDALWKAGHAVQARACYEESIAKWPDRDDFVLSLSHLLEELGDLDAAARVCSDYCARGHEKAQVWFRLAYVQWKCNDSAGSVAGFSRALELKPDWPEAEVNLALACCASGELDRAEQVLSRLLARDPENLDALKGLATIALARQEDERALELHNKLLERGEKTAEVYFNCGVLSQSLNRPENAVRYYRQAVEQRPDFAEALLNLGHALKSTGESEQAKDVWIPALELNPGFALDYFQRRG